MLRPSARTLDSPERNTVPATTDPAGRKRLPESPPEKPTHQLSGTHNQPASRCFPAADSTGRSAGARRGRVTPPRTKPCRIGLGNEVDQSPMARSGIDEDFYPADLRVGIRKRAGFARAIARAPDLPFFNEPSAGLNRLPLELRDSLGSRLRCPGAGTSSAADCSPIWGYRSKEACQCRERGPSQRCSAPFLQRQGRTPRL